jgi:hypothetical protein
MHFCVMVLVIFLEKISVNLKYIMTYVTSPVVVWLTK